jgi:ubiquinone/menaquinone biosynthesis C-methylase UbiE
MRWWKRYLAAKGADVTGLDISRGLLKEAQKRNQGSAFVYGNFLDIPFNDAVFDGVWAHAALVHLETIPEVRKSFKEFHRVLKDKGILHIYVKLQRGEEKTEVAKDTLSNHERFFRYYTEEEIRDYLDELNFTILDFSIRKDGHDRAEVTWICVFAKK